MRNAQRLAASAQQATRRGPMLKLHSVPVRNWPARPVVQPTDSNFVGWLVVGVVGVGIYLALAGAPPARRPWLGVALYYVVLGFNLAVTAWIGEWPLLVIGTALHVLVAIGLKGFRSQRATAVSGVSEREVQV